MGPSHTLAALETLYDSLRGSDLPLPPRLADFYGRLQFPDRADRPHIIGNMVSTLDGVVALDRSGHSTGRDISGRNRQDAAVMGLLRAVADAIIVGAGTVRTVPQHIWTAQHIYRPFTAWYEVLRDSMHQQAPPLNIVVSGSGELPPDLALFETREAHPLIVTTVAGAQRLQQRSSTKIPVIALVDAERISAHALLQAILRYDANRPGMVRRIILVEGGPHLLGSFCAEGCLDELFMVLAPQIAGRDDVVERPGLVAGALLAPEHPLWGTLVSVKRSQSHLFLRYAFDTEQFWSAPHDDAAQAKESA